MIGTPLVHCWYSLGRLVTISTPMVFSVFDDWYSVRIVKNSQKTVKQQKMTIGVQIVTCLHRVCRIHKAAQTPLPCETSIIMFLGSGHSPSPVGRADCMCLHGRPCVWLPFAAACCYTLLPTDDACSSSSLSTTVIKFSIFSDPTRKLSVLRPNSVEYGNSKTTTLLPSAKCTRPLFLGQTGCGGRLSGWHDIVTCQRLVYN